MVPIGFGLPAGFFDGAVHRDGVDVFEQAGFAQPFDGDLLAHGILVVEIRCASR